ncbi:MAG: MutS-related protein, partial [Anaerolineae bacterium]
RITRVVAALSLRENLLLRFILNALLPWDAFLAHRLNRTKADIAERAPAWMDVWFELEALSSLANFGYLNPEYSFPDIVALEGQDPVPPFDARGLGHPLIPDEGKVCNDFTVPQLGQVTVITGSNMAGKSVFLKTVGVNLALAYAGGPVSAKRLRALPFRLFTSMGISDSVTDGISFFYAEVRRLKALVTELEREHPLPLLFCIDEIFRGTNNRERLIGSRAYVRALAGKHGLGFIATHDLELAKLAGELPQVVNFHFRDRVEDGRMVFDYVLQPGPCPTTNALRIMQLEGLPVDAASMDAASRSGDPL